MEVLSGFLLGLANNAYCIGTCAPVLLPYMLQDEAKPVGSILQFLGGRFIAYVAFGLLSGVAGIYFEGRIDRHIFALLMMIMALWLIVYALLGLSSSPFLCQARKNKAFLQFPFFAGIVMGLNLCPPFIAGMARTLQMASIIKPVIFFFSFFVGSSLWVGIFVFTGTFSRKEEFRRIGRLTSLLVGLWYLGEGILTFLR